MGWWPFRPRSGSGADSANEAGSTRRVLLGRRFLRGVPYVLPKDMGEVSRLDFQHYMMRAALRGNYAAPIGNPDSILDVGCGTGRWAIEMAMQFPHANVIGIDVVLPSAEEPAEPPARPANHTFLAGNILEGLPFPDRNFAFVHQRYMIGAIPRDQWPPVVRELMRVTRPGGWVELVEAGTSEGGGPALQTIDAWVASVLARRGLDIHLGRHLGAFLQEAGARNVTARHVPLPLGGYGGRMGNLVETDYFAAVSAMRAPVVALGISTEQDYENVVQAAREEVRQGRCVFPVYVVYGQRR
jgi:ubiquinone/menaquinone biosynthesis C-methylase UbiE